MCTTPPESAVADTFLRHASETELLRHTNRTGAAAPQTSAEGRPALLDLADGPPEGIDPALMSRLAQWTAFNVLAIRIDSPPGDPDSSGEPHATLHRLLNALQSGHGAVWFPWQTGLYGCVVPEVGTETALALASALQADLVRERPETVSIGIAAFPLISFNRTQSLANACKALEHAAFFGPGSAVIFDAVSLNISGDQHYQAGDMGAAMAEYRAALRLDPQNVNVHNSLGVCMARIKDFGAARESFQAALAINPHESMAAFNLGMLKRLENEAEAALALFESAHSLDPLSFDINLQLGISLVELARWAEARPFLEAAVTQRADNARAHCWLGQCLAGLARLPEAIQALTRAAKLNPNDAAALSALGALYAAKGENPDVCMTFCRQSVLLAPQNGLYRHRLGCLYKQYDQLDSALAEFESAAALGYDSTSDIDEIRHLIGVASGPDPAPDQQLAAS